MHHDRVPCTSHQGSCIMIRHQSHASCTSIKERVGHQASGTRRWASGIRDHFLSRVRRHEPNQAPSMHHASRIRHHHASRVANLVCFASYTACARVVYHKPWFAGPGTVEKPPTPRGRAPGTPETHHPGDITDPSPPSARPAGRPSLFQALRPPSVPESRKKEGRSGLQPRSSLLVSN